MKNKTQLIKKAKITKNELEKIHKECNRQIEKLNTKTNTLFSTSLVILTIQLSFITEIVCKLLKKIYTKKTIYLLILIIFFTTNIIYNTRSILQFQKSLRITGTLTPDKDEINEYLNDNHNIYSFLKRDITSYNDSIQEDQEIIRTKNIFIDKGLKFIL